MLRGRTYEEVCRNFKWEIPNITTSGSTSVIIGKKSHLVLKLSRIAIDQGLHSSFEQTLELEAGHLLICAGAQNQQKFVERKLEKMKGK